MKRALPILLGGSVFGNPWSHLDGTKARFKVFSREAAIRMYTDWLEGRLVVPELQTQREVLWLGLRKLAARVRAGEKLTLVCFCAPLACHGDVLKVHIEKLLEEA